MASYEQEAELQKLYEERKELFEQMNKSAKSMLGIFQQLNATMKNRPIADAADDTEAWNEAIMNAAEHVSTFDEKANSMFENMQSSMPTINKLMSDFKNKLDLIGQRGLILAPLIAGLTGFGKGLKLSVNAMGSLFNVTKNVAASLGHVALSIISFPFKMLKGLLSMAQSGGGDNGLRQELENIRKEFGDLRTNASAAIIDISRSIRGPLAETGLSAYRIFGNLKERLEVFHKVATNLGPLFDMIRGQLSRSAVEAERFGAYLKGLGIEDSPEAQQGLARLSITTGQSLNEIGREITSFAYQMGEAFGINGKTISRDVSKMTKDFESFGNLSIQTLTNVSIYARKLGVEVEKLKGVLPTFDDFEKAAEGAANLSQAFGLNLDAFQLVQEQDPAARIEQLRKAFFAAGKSVENMTRQERALLAEQTGLDQETLSLVFAQKSASTSYADIQKQSEATKKKQLSQAEAMEKLANSIERMVKSGSGLQGGFFKIFFDGFTRGIMISTQFRGLMRDLRQDMRIVFQAGRQVGREFVNSFPGVKDMLEGLREIFNPAEWRRRMAGVKDIFGRFFRDLSNPNDRSRAFGTFVNNMKEHFKDLFDANTPRGSKFLNGLKSFLRAFANIFTSGLRVALDGVRSGLRMLTEFIRDPSAAMARLRAGGASGGSFIMTELVIPILDTLREVGPDIWNAFKELLSTIWTRISGPIGEFLPRIATVMFAPAVINSTISTGVTALGSILLRLFGGAAIDRFFSRESKNISQSVQRGVGNSFQEAATNLGNQARDLNPNLNARTASTVSSATPVVEASNQLGQATPTATPNPASLLKTAAFIAIGVVAVVGAIIALAYVIKNTSLTAGDIALSTATLLGATLIVGAIGFMAIALTAAAPAGAAAPALFVPMLGLLALAAAMTLGVVGLSMLIKSQGLTAGDIGLSVLTIAGAVAIIGATAIGAVELGAIGILSIGFAAIAAGAAAAGTFALALVYATDKVIKEFKALNIADIAITASKIGSTLLIFGALTALAVGFGVVGSAGLAAIPFVTAGIKLVSKFAKTIVSEIKTIILDINTIPATNNLQQKVDIVTTIMGALTNFMSAIGDALGGTSVIAAILPGTSTIESQVLAMSTFIQRVGNTLSRMVIDIIRVTSSVRINEQQLNATQSIVNIIDKLGSFIGNLAQAIPDNIGDVDNIEGFINGMSNLFSRITNNMVSLMRHTFNIVQGIITQAGNLDAGKVSAINGLATAMTSIITGIANLFGTMLRTSAIQSILSNENAPALLNNLGSFFSRVINSLRESNFFNSISLVISAITNGVGNLNAAEAANLYNLGRVLGPVLDTIRVIIGMFGSIPANITAGAGLDAKLASMSTALHSLARGFGESIGVMVGALVDSFSAIKPEEIRPLQAKIAPLQALFNTVKILAETLATFGGGTAIDPNAVMGSLEKVYKIVVGSGPTGGWSLLNFSTHFGNNLQALNANLANASIVQTLGTNTQAYVNGVVGMINGLAPLFREEFVNTVNSTRIGATSQLETVISDYSTFVTRMNADLANLASRTNNFQVNLGRVRDRLGLSGRQRSSLQLNNMTVNINVDVKLSVDDIERSIATRTGGSSFAITAEPGKQRLAEIGHTPSETQVFNPNPT